MINQNWYWKTWIIGGCLIFILLVLINGLEMKVTVIWALIKAAASAAGLTLLLEGFVFKKLIWRKIPHVFYPWLTSIPYIGGTWKGTLISDFIKPNGDSVEPIETEIKIIHDIDKIYVRLKTDQSYSSSLVSDVYIDQAQIRYLIYTYNNNVDENRNTNPQHDGTARLRINHNKKGELVLEGHYFTNRKTTGKMTFERTDKKRPKV